MPQSNGSEGTRAMTKSNNNAKTMICFDIMRID